jgi:2-iminobutanoate/2-iminopropanoate deaminase
MKKEIIRVPGVKGIDLPFNHVVKAGDLIFLTSQLSCDLGTGAILPGDMAAQTKNTLENVRYLLQESGSSLDHVLTVRIYMRDVSGFDEMNRVYREYFKGGNEPARVTVQAPSPIGGIDLEMEVIAVVAARGRET